MTGSVNIKVPDTSSVGEVDSFVVEEVKVREGAWVHKGQLLMTIRPVIDDDVPKTKWFRIKAGTSGKIANMAAKRKDVVYPGSSIITISTDECSHPTIMKNMCADCGADLQRDMDPIKASESSSASIAVLHSIPELKVSSDEAVSLGREDERRLLQHRRLVLLVDLDQTLIHTTNEDIPPNLKDVYHFQLYGPKSPWYHTRIRPRTAQFLENIAKYYELHIVTFGARLYAHTIAKFLDKDSKYFSHRILSRDECFDSRSKTANLSSLFPCGDHMVCIIDDREDVWNYAPNLVHVKPYIFFKNTGDINAPPGSSKVPLKPGSETKQGNQSKNDKERERRDSIDMPTIDDDAGAVPSNKEKEVDEVSKVSDDLELSDESNGSSGTSSSSDSSSKSSKSNSPKTEDKEKAKPEVAKNEPNPRSTEETVDTKDAKEKEGKKEEGEDSDSSGKSGIDDGDDLPNKEPEETSTEKVEDDLMDVEDTDDYLLYLEDTLKAIHKDYYKAYDSSTGKDGTSPDLKQIIPKVKRKVLQGTNIVFSGVVPTHVQLHKSKPFLVAKSLGAKVTDKVTKETTHLVAARVGTVKVNEARKRAKTCHILTPDWLWCCAERWERVDERLYPLYKSAPVTIKPPAHCSSPEDNAADRIPEIIIDEDDDETNDGFLPAVSSKPPAPERQTSKDSLPETMNPYLAFSSEDLQGMDKEVDDILSNESLSSSSDEESKPPKSTPPEKNAQSESDEEAAVEQVEQVELSESSSDGSDSYPRGVKRKHFDEGGDGPADGDPLERFRRGEEIPDDDFDIAEQSDDEDCEEDRAMAAKLEQELMHDYGDSNSNL